MKDRHGGPDGPEDVDAAFAEIIADLEREGFGRELEDDQVDQVAAPTATLDRTPEPDTGPSADRADRADAADRVDADGSAEADGPAGPAEADGPDTEQLPAGRPPGASWRGHDTEWDWSWGSDDEHYVPPEPPPLPRLRPVTILAIILLVIGLVLMVVPNIIGLAPRLGTPIALVSIGVGIVLLLLRIRNDPARDRGEGDDDGAQI